MQYRSMANNTMMTRTFNQDAVCSHLAKIVAERASARMEEELEDLVQDLTMSVMIEHGYGVTDEDAYEMIVDIATRIYIGSL